MSIIGKVYKVREAFLIWQTDSHAAKNYFECIEAKNETKMIYLGSIPIDEPPKFVTKLLIDGVIWYTYYDPIIDPKYFKEL